MPNIWIESSPHSVPKLVVSFMEEGRICRIKLQKGFVEIEDRPAAQPDGDRITRKVPYEDLREFLIGREPEDD